MPRRNLFRRCPCKQIPMSRSKSVSEGSGADCAEGRPSRRSGKTPRRQLEYSAAHHRGRAQFLSKYKGRDVPDRILQAAKDAGRKAAQAALANLA